MTERPRKLGDFKVVVHFEAIHFRLKDYVLLRLQWTVR